MTKEEFEQGEKDTFSYQDDAEFYKRHTCIICKRKRYERYMKKVLISSWACTDKYHFQNCCDNEEIRIAERIRKDLKNMKFINVLHIVPDFSVPKYIRFSGCGLFEKNNTLLFDEIPGVYPGADYKD